MFFYYYYYFLDIMTNLDDKDFYLFFNRYLSKVSCYFNSLVEYSFDLVIGEKNKEKIVN